MKNLFPRAVLASYALVSACDPQSSSSERRDDAGSEQPRNEPIRDAGSEPEQDAGSVAPLPDAGMEQDSGVDAGEPWPMDFETSVPNELSGFCTATFDETVLGQYAAQLLWEGEFDVLGFAYEGTSNTTKHVGFDLDPAVVIKGSSFLMEHTAHPLIPDQIHLKGFASYGEWVGLDLSIRPDQPWPFVSNCAKGDEVKRYVYALEELAVFADDAYTQPLCTVPAAKLLGHERFDFFCSYRDDEWEVFPDGHGDCHIDLTDLSDECGGATEGYVSVPAGKTSVLAFIGPAFTKE